MPILEHEISNLENFPGFLRKSNLFANKISWHFSLIYIIFSILVICLYILKVDIETFLRLTETNIFGLNEGMYVGQDAKCRKQMDIVNMRIRTILF